MHVLQDREVGLSVAGIPLERLGGLWGPELVPPPLPADTSGKPARPARIMPPFKEPFTYSADLWQAQEPAPRPGEAGRTPP